MRRARPSIAANPVLVGAVTTLVVVVAVFLSYNANNGLPFVPTYNVHALLPDAAELVPGNDVRIGGTRVGVVKAVEAVPGPKPTDPPLAKLTLALETGVKPLAQNTIVTVRQRSNLGLKYVELTPGSGGATIPDGGTIALRQATGVVDLDDAISAFDPATRDSLRGVIREMGVGLAGRGDALNRAIEELPPALGALRTVAATLRSPAADLPRFLVSARSAVVALAPVAAPLADLFGAGAQTFAALADENPTIARLLEETPGTEAVGVRGFQAARPVFAQAAGLLADAGPGVRLLAPAARRLDAGLAAAGPALARAQTPVRDLRPVLARLQTLSRRPSTTDALAHLTATVASTAHALQVIAPFQTKCNYFGLWARNVPSVVSEGDRMGTWFRFIPIVQLDQDLQSAKPAPSLHADTTPDTGAGGECEPGNEAFLPGQQIGSVPGVQPLRTESTSPPAREGVR